MIFQYSSVETPEAMSADIEILKLRVTNERKKKSFPLIILLRYVTMDLLLKYYCVQVDVSQSEVVIHHWALLKDDEERVLHSLFSRDIIGSP